MTKYAQNVIYALGCRCESKRNAFFPNWLGRTIITGAHFRLERGQITMKKEEFLRNIIPINDKELFVLLENVSHIDTFRKGARINNQNELDYYVRFLINGAVRAYIINAQGKETTTAFVMKPGEVIAGSRLLDGSPSEIFFQAIKESEIFSIPVEIVLALRTKYEEIENLFISMLTQTSVYHWETKKMLYLKTAKERYDWFMREYPGLIDSVSHADVASFLNITPVTLSRIRHEE